jgi:predicted DNA-binding transcriptional regulator YafY
MPSNKSALLRYRIIDGCLTNKMHSYPSIDFIRRKIEGQLNSDISESMIRKDFAAMKDVYTAPIQFHKGRGGYYYTEPDFSIKEFPLTNEEISALDFSTALLHNLKDTQIFKQFENAINKLIEGYRISKVIGKSEKQLIQIEEPLKTQGNQWLEPILEAIINKNCLKITYARYGGEPKEHVVSACLLKEYHNRWYLVGHSKRSDNLLVMALDRIQAIEPSSEPFASLDQFQPDEFFKYSFGITQFHDVSPEKILLKFNPHTAQYIISQPLHHSQQVIAENETEVVVQLEVYISQELVMAILSHGAAVEVLEPQYFRDRIKDLISEMLVKYQ